MNVWLMILLGLSLGRGAMAIVAYWGIRQSHILTAARPIISSGEA